MTSPQVSEAEVEAAARPIAEVMYRDYKSAEGYATISDCELSNASPTTVEMWMSDARPVASAALTAAAQVRERERERVATDLRPRKVIGRVTGKLLDGDQVPGMPHAICHACGLKNYSCSNPDCPNKAFAATEPDSGPDVLGEQKEEE